MINFQKAAGQKVLELGGGANRQPVTDCNVDVVPGPTVDFVWDLSKTPWPLQDNEWDAVLAIFILEHISYRVVPNFLTEVLRVLKPSGRAVFAIPNTEAQIKWINEHSGGWDGKGPFESMSEVLFGSQDYESNHHLSYFSPMIASTLFRAAGFEGMVIQPYNERGTDMVVEATKSTMATILNKGLEGARKTTEALNQALAPVPVRMQEGPNPGEYRGEVPAEAMKENSVAVLPITDPAILYGKDYFNGGQKFGGYKNDQWGAYRDFPVHEITARHVLSRRPEGVLELGAARGYVGKRLEDAGVRYCGLEVSKHCWMTRATNWIFLCDLTAPPPWPNVLADLPDGRAKLKDKDWDLCFSIATMEHIPETVLPAVIGEMVRTCRRGLHGIDFGSNDDGFDKTHCTLHERKWWLEQFAQHAPGWPVEIVDKEELEQGRIPSSVLEGDGKVKLEIGSWTVMNHHGWENIDIGDLVVFAQQNGYKYRRHDVKAGLPYQTGTVDLIHSSHVLEHFTYAEARTLLKEFRRVLKAGGVVRIAVPDAKLLMTQYCERVVNSASPYLEHYNEINDGAAAAPTAAGKLWELLHSGHQSCFDEETLALMLTEAGFESRKVAFRETKSGEAGKQILRETLDGFPCLSLYMEGVA